MTSNLLFYHTMMWKQNTTIAWTEGYSRLSTRSIPAALALQRAGLDWGPRAIRLCVGSSSFSSV